MREKLENFLDILKDEPTSSDILTIQAGLLDIYEDLDMDDFRSIKRLIEYATATEYWFICQDLLEII